MLDCGQMILPILDAKGLACPTLGYERAAALPANSRLHRGKWGLDWQT